MILSAQELLSKSIYNIVDSGTFICLPMRPRCLAALFVASSSVLLCSHTPRIECQGSKATSLCWNTFSSALDHCARWYLFVRMNSSTRDFMARLLKPARSPIEARELVGILSCLPTYLQVCEARHSTSFKDTTISFVNGIPPGLMS